ncbi:Flp family type IVb pilin [Pseudomonas chlororaphis]|nr:Flp family type IVb pilin [Pseudomonas chlororaphis]
MLHEAILKLTVKLQMFFQEKDGASGIEYAILAAMIAVVIAGFVTPIGSKIFAVFTSVAGGLTSST